MTEAQKAAQRKLDSANAALAKAEQAQALASKQSSVTRAQLNMLRRDYEQAVTTRNAAAKLLERMGK